MGPEKDEWKSMPDMSKLEVATVAPLMVGTLILGCFPYPLLQFMQASVSHICDFVSGSGVF